MFFGNLQPNTIVRKFPNQTFECFAKTCRENSKKINGHEGGRQTDGRQLYKHCFSMIPARGKQDFLLVTSLDHRGQKGPGTGRFYRAIMGPLILQRHLEPLPQCLDHHF